MNIFAVDDNPVTAANLCDRHVVKMTLETAQILSTIVPGEGRYRPTHKNHPCTVWAASSPHNLAWLVRHGLALAEQYTRRYGKVHASERIIGTTPIPDGASYVLHTPFVQVMPEQYRQTDPVEAYRAFYCAEKKEFATWKSPATPPRWFV